MDRDSARQEIRSRWREILPTMTAPARQRVNGETSYICPMCGHGEHGDGLTFDPKSRDRNTLHCFGCGFSGDIIDLYKSLNHCDHNTAFSLLAQECGITIDRAETARKLHEHSTETAQESHENSPETARKPHENGTETAQKEQGGENMQQEPLIDYTAYYEQCAARLGDPEAVAYLTGRGISAETAAAYNLGYDPEWISPAAIRRLRAEGNSWTPPGTARIIAPVTANHYLARAISADIEKKYQKQNETGGGSVGIFNAGALHGDSKAVFVVEGVFDALSIIEAGGEAVALNSTSNADLFLEQLKQEPTTATLVICLDNDEAGQSAAGKIKAGAAALNVKNIAADITGDYKDANEALTGNRQAFVNRVKAAQMAAEKEGQPVGLLTLERAVQILESVDDHYLELPQFPQLSEMLKIKKNDTIVIAADTGAGKSSLALNFLHELQDKYPALYINLDMDEATILQRLVSIHTGTDLDVIEGYKHDQSTRDQVNKAINEIIARKEIRLIADIYGLDEIEEQIKAATKDREEPTIVFVDTGLLVTVANRSASRYERFTQISEGLRRMSRLNNIIMFVLLQQNREGKKEEKEPTNSSLKESGSWENDATKIMFLWNNPETMCKEIMVTKNRSGKTGSVQLNYSAHTQTYSERKDGQFETPKGSTPFEVKKRGRNR